ncbi:MAG: L,D-transpeptidase family protein [Geminicoccaceae bacterium]
MSLSPGPDGRRTDHEGAGPLLACLVVLAALVAAILPGAGSAGEVEEAIGGRVAALAAAGHGEVGGVAIEAVPFVVDFYGARQDRRAWLDTVAGDELLAEIRGSERHGLRPVDFHGDRLPALLDAARTGDPSAIAAFELVATDAAALLLHHLYRGKVDATRLDPDWNFHRPVVTGDSAGTISVIVDQKGFAVIAERVALRHPQYLALQDALARYRLIAAAGGWPRVPPGETLRPGMADPRVPALRARLMVTGELGPVPVAGEVYDEAVVAAVQRFQLRHGLDADGAIGPQTLRALNRTVEERIDQLRLSLERARWVLRGIGKDFVLVNIAGARTYVYKGGNLVWRTRSIVGQQYRKTPIFRDEIRYMELNPTWTVPRKIFVEDKLPLIQADPGFLARGGYRVLDRDWQVLDPSAVDWWAPDPPPVTLVQAPGPGNALGQVKFMFPNRFSVYLHDTNDRSLFDRAARSLSSGCVRIEQPFVLADLLMDGDPTWSHARLEAILASGRTTRIDLPKPMPVLLTYYTAWVEDGEVLFREDIYDRDERVLEALDGPFRG